MTRNWSRHLLVVAACLLVNAVWGCTSADESQQRDVGMVVDSLLVMPPPSSIEEMVADKRDIIAVGEATENLATSVIVFTETDEPGSTDEPERVMDKIFEVDTILLDRWGDIDGGPPPTFTLRVIDGSSYPMLNTQYLIIATLNEDEPGTTYSSMFGPKDLIIANSSPLRYADGEIVPYAIGLTFAEFLEQLEDELESQ